jgi:ribosome-associated protein
MSKKSDPKKDTSNSKESLETRKLADVIADGLLDKKGKDVVILDVRGLTTLTDYFVVCHGTSETQIKALADSVEDKTLEKLGEKPWKREGFDARRWIILDYVTVVVHIFSAEKREFYGIERMWNDAKRIEVTD